MNKWAKSTVWIVFTLGLVFTKFEKKCIFELAETNKEEEMENIIIIGIVVVLIGIGVYSGRKHFKGQGGCCGGGAPIPEQNKKLENIVAQKTVVIEGMTCSHCKNWVEKSINGIEGAAAKVNLQKKEAVVSLAGDVSDDQIRAAVQKAGYKVIEIR